jgi:hypothetical protein
MDAPSVYNVLIGRTALSKAQATISVRGSIVVYISDLGQVEKLTADPDPGGKLNSEPGIERSPTRRVRKEYDDVMDVEPSPGLDGTESEEVDTGNGRTVLI